MMEGDAGAGQAPDRRTRRVAAPRGHPLPPRRIGDPSGMPPVRRGLGTRAAGPGVRSGRGLGRAGAGSQPPSMDFSQLGSMLLWIRCFFKDEVMINDICVFLKLKLIFGMSSRNVSCGLPNSFLAARMASLTAQWTDGARTTAGSPEAGRGGKRCNYVHVALGKEISTLLPFDESRRFLWYPVLSTSALNCFGMVPDTWDLVDPCAVTHNQPISVCFVFFVYEETNSLYKGAFNL